MRAIPRWDREILNAFSDCDYIVNSLFAKPGKVLGKQALRILPDGIYLKLLYRYMTGKKLNIVPPETFNEKVQWKKLHDRCPVLTLTADKLRAREYVSERLGNGALSRVFWKGTPSSLSFEALPVSFVIKVNHGSGFNIIVRHKHSIDERSILRTLFRWFRTDYWLSGREWAYKDISRLVYVEECLCGPDGTVPCDYKFYVFSGKVRAIQVDVDRFGDHKRTFFDEDWNRLQFSLIYPNAEEEIAVPYNLELMKEYAEILGKDFDFVRVDLYDLRSRVVFGEMTHYPEGGWGRFSPDAYDRWLGAHWKLSLSR